MCTNAVLIFSPKPLSNDSTFYYFDFNSVAVAEPEPKPENPKLYETWRLEPKPKLSF